MATRKIDEVYPQTKRKTRSSGKPDFVPVPAKKTRSLAKQKGTGPSTKTQVTTAQKPSTSKDKNTRDEQLQILKSFDLNWEYGPCTGVTRLERWQRAQKHNLHPPVTVKEILTEHQDDEEFTKCLWNDYEL